MNKIKSLYLEIFNNLGLITVLIVGGILRFKNLGYSDYQGDEIKALFIPNSDESLWEFLLTQRKGPIQFIITFLIKLIDPEYLNQFLVRFPFALAGFIALFYFYRVVNRNFNQKIAFYSSLLLATNGFFVAFSRIAQYQSYVILFGILSVYFMDLAVSDTKYFKKGVLLSAFYLALSILSHYDGIFFAPILLVMFIKWIKSAEFSKTFKTKTTLIAASIFLGLNLLFYIPFVFYITQGTKDYWVGRLTGGASDKISSSYYLFIVYQPIYVIHFYIGLFLVGTIITLLVFLASKFNYKANFFNLDLINKTLLVLIWFAIPFIFWEKIVYISGTHIYTYLIPACVIIAVGIYQLEKIYDTFTQKVKILKPALIKNASILLIFSFIIVQSYSIFVENTYEYPWEQEDFLFWTMSKPTPSYHLSMFGFPYNRNWEGIERFIKEKNNVSAYSTNERDSISRYFVPLKKDANLAGYYIYIRNPQSFADNILSEKALYWSSKYPPVYTLSRNGTDLVNIYLMEAGPLDVIKEKGF